MRKKVIKNWKVIIPNLDSVTAFKIFKNRTIDGKLYDIIGLRLGWRAFQSDINSLDNESFSSKEILSDKWEIMLPDDEMEAILYKMRDMYKEEHFSGLSFDKIDNMSISDLYHALIDHMSSLDDMNKYRIAKWIIENKIYKKV